MAEYIKREAAIAYIREQSEEWQKAFEELGEESGIYADAYNDLAEDFTVFLPPMLCLWCGAWTASILSRSTSTGKEFPPVE
nr:MAG TPA: apolipoprotein [Caudoviricetes sp.]